MRFWITADISRVKDLTKAIERTYVLRDARAEVYEVNGEKRKHPGHLHRAGKYASVAHAEADHFSEWPCLLVSHSRRIDMQQEEIGNKYRVTANR